MSEFCHTGGLRNSLRKRDRNAGRRMGGEQDADLSASPDGGPEPLERVVRAQGQQPEHKGARNSHPGENRRRRPAAPAGFRLRRRSRRGGRNRCEDRNVAPDRQLDAPPAAGGRRRSIKRREPLADEPGADANGAVLVQVGSRGASEQLDGNSSFFERFHLPRECALDDVPEKFPSAPAAPKFGAAHDSVQFSANLRCGLLQRIALPHPHRSFVLVTQVLIPV